LDDDDGDADSDDARQRYAFPELDAQIRAAISEYGAVFPKLNFSSPRVRACRHFPHGSCQPATGRSMDPPSRLSHEVFLARGGLHAAQIV
jgi:hypothetical protein